MGKAFVPFLVPLKGKAHTKPVIAFDCETWGRKNKFVCGVISEPEQDLVFTDASTMVERLTRRENQGHFIYATKLNFDAFVLLQEIAGEKRIPPGWSLFDNGSRLIWVKRELRDRQDKQEGRKQKEYITLMDSLNVFPQGVEAMGNILLKESKSQAKKGNAKAAAYWLEKKLQAPGCRCDPRNEEHEGCKTFLGKLSWHNMSLDQRKELVTYCAADARVTRKFMEWFNQEVVMLGGQPRMTAASTALDLFRRKYMLQESRVIPQPHWTCLVESRLSYYGGRTEDFVKGTIPDVWDYDVTAMYPASMIEIQFPYPSPERFIRRNAPSETVLKYEGFSHVVIDVPYMDIPPLPYREVNKLLFPFGRLQGVWTNLELRYAIGVGCQVQEIKWSYFTEKTFNPFMGYVNDLFGKRMSYAFPDDCDELTCLYHHGDAGAKCACEMASEAVIKLYLNGLYGKFAQNFLTELEAAELGVKTKKGGGTFKRIEDATPEEIAYTGANHPEYLVEGYVIDKAVPKLKSFMNPILSSYVTARARCKLHAFIMRAIAEGAIVLYTDTDSLYVTKPLSFAVKGKALGDLATGKQWERMTILGPKTKRLVDQKGKAHDTAKGVPGKSFLIRDETSMRTERVKPREALFESLSFNQHPSTTYSKFLNPKEALIRGKAPNEIVEMTKTFDFLAFPKRRILGNPQLEDLVLNHFETVPWEIDGQTLQIVGSENA